MKKTAIAVHGGAGPVTELIIKQEQQYKKKRSRLQRWRVIQSFKKEEQLLMLL
ncbi:hypothetical protein [Niabella ginsenosidivorans]|uniref:hypothetical protein n=1 Tax=Niabella ginsenosidivorans TaxID=1176587 RepID=UPI0012ED914F|nr:hypothetical protein [Niabella ginsenosidivorans]